MRMRSGVGTLFHFARQNGWTDPDDEALAGTRPAGPHFITVSPTMELPPRPYILKSVFGISQLVIVVAPSGVGKTTLLVYLADAIARGEPAFGLRTRQGTILYCAAEDPAGVQARCVAQAREHGEAPSNLWIMLGAADVLNPDGDGYAILLEKVRETGAAVVILDTLHASLTDHDENDGRATGKLLATARKIMDLGAAVIFIHHPGKHDAAGRPRGHGALLGAADVVLALAPSAEDPKTVLVTLAKTKDTAGDTRLAFRIEGRTVGTDADGDPVTAAVAVPVEAAGLRGTAAKPRARDKARQIAVPLASRPGGVTFEEAVDACVRGGISIAPERESRKKAARRALNELITAGVLLQPEEGLLTLPSPDADDVFEEVG